MLLQMALFNSLNDWVVFHYVCINYVRVYFWAFYSTSLVYYFYPWPMQHFMSVWPKVLIWGGQLPLLFLKIDVFLAISNLLHKLNFFLKNYCIFIAVVFNLYLFTEQLASLWYCFNHEHSIFLYLTYIFQ